MSPRRLRPSLPWSAFAGFCFPPEVIVLSVIDVFISARHDADAARRFFERAIGTTKVTPVEVTTDQAPVYLGVLEELLPATWHRTDRYDNNHIEADHGRLKRGWDRCGAQAGPQRQGDHRRAWLGAEPSTRTL